MKNIGAHVSVAGGLYKAIENAENIGAETIQIFGASPRQWGVKLPTQKEAEEFKQAFKASKVKSVFLHAAYLVNIATPDPLMRFKSIVSLTNHLKIADLIGADGLIFHIGTKKDSTAEEAIEKCVDAMKQILEKVPGNTKLIIENNAGEGRKFGTTPEEIGPIIKQLNSDRVAICIDTAHSFESGAIQEYSEAGIKKFFDSWDQEAGKNKVIVMHINDSKTAMGSKHDRHENIGEGYIGLQGFKNLAKDKRSNNIPWILETPGFDGNGPDEKNIKLLQSCFE